LPILRVLTTKNRPTRARGANVERLKQGTTQQANEKVIITKFKNKI